MKTIQFILALFLTWTASPFSQSVSAHPAAAGTVIKELTDLPFDEVSIGSCFKVTFSQAPAYQVRIRIEDHLEPHLVYGIDDGKLFIRMDRYSHSFFRKKLHHLPRVEISAPDFKLLELQGASQLRLGGKWILEEADISVQGACEMVVGHLEARRLSINQQGASSIHASIAAEKLHLVVSGACKMELENCGRLVGEQLTMQVSGAAKVDLDDLPYHQVTLHVSGASKVSVCPLKRLDGVVSGASKVEYEAASGLDNSLRTSGVASVRAD